MVTTLSLRRSVAQAQEPEIPLRIGDYAIVRQIGSGGMGTVFEGRHLLLDRRAAVKVIREDMRTSPIARDRLLREGRALAKVQHPNVVGVFEFGGGEHGAFIAMELVAGTTLREWMRAPRATPEILDVFIVIGEALIAVHAHDLVHRDVNPSNVFVSEAGTPKLGDFGLVARCDERDDAVVGTLPYMAPEQTFGEPVDPRADQYSFCVSLYEALAGQLPDPDAPNALPRPLRAIVSQGLSILPERRFASMREVVIALESARRSLAWRWIRPRS